MRYVAGTDLQFEIPLVDANGASVDATAISYSVLDGNGAELLPSQALTGYTAGSDASITVPAALNAVGLGGTREAREIVLVCTTATGQSVVTHSYVIEVAGGSLVRGVNSFVTYASAEMLAEEMRDMDAWKAATKQQRINALMEAYRRLGKVRLNTRWFPCSSLLDMSVAEVLSIEARPALGMCNAQVAEASEILNGETDRRLDGLVLDTIGEVKQMYRSAKPVETPISRKALEFASPFIMSLSSKVIGRSS